MQDVGIFQREEIDSDLSSDDDIKPINPYELDSSEDNFSMNM